MVYAECPFCLSKMHLVERQGTVMNVPLRVFYWVCSNENCNAEFLKDYEKIKTYFLENLDLDALHIEDEIANEFLRRYEMVVLKEKVNGFHRLSESPFKELAKEHKKIVDSLKEIHAIAELHKALFKNPKTFISKKVRGYRFIDKLLLSLGLI